MQRACRYAPPCSLLQPTVGAMSGPGICLLSELMKPGLVSKQEEIVCAPVQPPPPLARCGGGLHVCPTLFAAPSHSARGARPGNIHSFGAHEMWISEQTGGECLREGANPTPAGSSWGGPAGVPHPERRSKSERARRRPGKCILRVLANHEIVSS